MSKVEFNINSIGSNKYKICLKVPLGNIWYDDVCIELINDNEFLSYKIKHKENKDGFIYFESDIELDTSAIYKFYINAKLNGNVKYLNRDNEFIDKINEFDARKLSVNFKVPDWVKGKMIYHIFVDRFYKGRKEKLPEMNRRNIHDSFDEDVVLGPDKDGIWNNDFYGGDLKGIIDKLDYIKSMGFSIIYLSPIVKSQSNHRYDTGDYLEIDPYCGSIDDLKELCTEAHKRGIKIILDAVFNHTGNDSKYFNEYGSYESDGVYNNPNSIYKNFYRYPLAFWWGFKNLPESDCNSLDWQEFICGEGGVIDQWFSCGIDGLRLDVADELTDEFIELIRIACERNKPDSFIYGEVWENFMRMNRRYVSSGKGMHSTMNYPWIDGLIRFYNYGDKDKLREKLDEIILDYPEDSLNSLMNSTSTHDFSRIITILSNPELFDYYAKWGWDLKQQYNNIDFIKNYKLSDEQLKKGIDKYLSYLISLGFLPGNFTVFYGDEVPIEGLGNLQNRRPFPWNKLDLNGAVISEIRSIGKIKNDYEFLCDADFKIIDINDKVFMYERYKNHDGILVGVNRSNEEVDIDVPKEYCSSEKVLSLKKSSINRLNGYGGIILKK